jgi:hypothetical protein
VIRIRIHIKYRDTLSDHQKKKTEVKHYFFSKNEHHIVCIVNRTVPKIIAISVHTVNHFPLISVVICDTDIQLRLKHGSAHIDQHGLQGIVTVSYKTYIVIHIKYRNTYRYTPSELTY